MWSIYAWKQVGRKIGELLGYFGEQADAIEMSESGVFLDRLRREKDLVYVVCRLPVSSNFS